MFEKHKALISRCTENPRVDRMIAHFSLIFNEDLGERFINFLKNSKALLTTFLMSNDLLEITLEERYKRIDMYISLLQNNKLYTLEAQSKLNELLSLLIFHNYDKLPEIPKNASLEDLRNLLVNIWMSRLPKKRQIQINAFPDLKGLEKELYHFFLYSGPRYRLFVVDSLEEDDVEGYSVFSDNLSNENSIKVNEWVDLMEYERVLLVVTYKGMAVAHAWLEKDFVVEVFCFKPKLKEDICGAIYEFIENQFNREIQRITFMRELYDEEESFTRLRKQLAISRASGILPENYRFG